MKKLITLAVLILAMLAIAACNSDNAAPLHQPDDGYDGFYGNIDLDEDDIYNIDIDDDIFGEDFDWGCNLMADMPVFGSWSGTVTEVEAVETDYETFIYIHLEGDDGNATFVSNFNIFVLGEEPAVGDYITGYYLMGGFMAMIYPPRYNVSVIVNGDFLAVAVDRFNEELVSYDGFLQLNMDESVEVILQSGEAFDGELAGRKLVVVYDISTRSIPAQTTPNKVVVLYEQAVALPGMLG